MHPSTAPLRASLCRSAVRARAPRSRRPAERERPPVDEARSTPGLCPGGGDCAGALDTETPSGAAPAARRESIVDATLRNALCSSLALTSVNGDVVGLEEVEGPAPACRRSGRTGLLVAPLPGALLE